MARGSEAAWGSLLANLLLFCVAIGLTVGAGEWVTRTVLSDVTTTADNTSWFARRWYEDHPPRLNRAGFRNRGFSPQPEPGVVRIAVVGDSFTWGQGIAERDRFTDLLQLEIGPNFEILNFGRPGAETVDELQILREHVLPARPDFVLLQWFVNDVEGASHGDRPVPIPLVPSWRVASWLHRHSALYYVVNRPWIETQVRVGLVESYRENMERRFGNPRSPASLAALAALESFAGEVHEAGVPMAIAVFPELSQLGLGQDRWAFLIDRLLAFCVDRAVSCIDLRPVLAPYGKGKALWANRLDSHPGPLAHRLAARAILEHLGLAWRQLAANGSEESRTRSPGAPADDAFERPSSNALRRGAAAAAKRTALGRSEPSERPAAPEPKRR